MKAAHTHDDDPDPDEGDDPGHEPGWMSIGALSRATGIAIGTLRSWERRYGFPEPQRLESGHRRYALDAVERLRLVKDALELGNRPGAVVAAPPEALQQLLGAVPAAGVGPPSLEGHLEALMATTLELDQEGLDRALQRAIDDLGVRRFVNGCAVPFLHEVGSAWIEGRLGVMHEHFASDRLKAALDQRRRGHGGAATVVCATLPGETHDLGLYMSSLLLALGGARVIFLGADTPTEDIAGAASQSAAPGVLIGSSAAAPSTAVVPQLAALRRLLPAPVQIAVGGTDKAPRGVTVLEDFAALEAWGAAIVHATVPS